MTYSTHEDKHRRILPLYQYVLNKQTKIMGHLRRLPFIYPSMRPNNYIGKNKKSENMECGCQCGQKGTELLYTTERGGGGIDSYNFEELGCNVL